MDGSFVSPETVLVATKDRNKTLKTMASSSASAPATAGTRPSLGPSLGEVMRKMPPP
jgi:hypothetical protein